MLLFCYEAGPCGYGLYRQLIGSGHDCQVVAPSLIPKKAGERIKNDRRDALKLARLLRSGDLTAVWVPDQEQERMRDLSRARDDLKAQERTARQQLNAFLLRHGQHWPKGKSRWTPAHENWLAGLKLDDPWQQVVLQTYIDAERAAGERVAQLTDQLMRALPEWSLAPVVDSLVALRGIDKLAAIVLLAELGDISRFDSPKQLMAFLGLVPSEHSSGGRRRQGAITLTGNSHARRMLVESAWSYRFPARQTKHLKAKAANASPAGETHRLEGAGAPVRALSQHDARRQEHQTGVRGHRPRARRFSLGYRPPGDAAPGANASTRDERLMVRLYTNACGGDGASLIRPCARRTDTLTQGIRGRCGEPLFGLYRWCTGESLNGHSMHRSLLSRERPAPRRSEVRWYPIHVYQHDPPSQSAAGCPEPMCLQRPRHRPVDMWTSPHPCGPARAKAVWTTHGPRRSLGATRQHRAGAAHRLPTLSGLSPTYPQALQQTVLNKRGNPPALPG